MGQTDAAGGIRVTFDLQKQDVRDGLTVIYETDHYPPHPLAVHPRVPEAVAHGIQRALLDMGTDPDGERLLAEIPIKAMGTAHDEDYDGLRKLKLEEFSVEQ